MIYRSFTSGCFRLGEKLSMNTGRSQQPSEQM